MINMLLKIIGVLGLSVIVLFLLYTAIIIIKITIEYLEK